MAQSSSVMGRVRLALWGLVILAGIGATILYLVRPPERPVAVFGGPFTLQSTLGGTFTQDNLKGTPSAIFFGYTFCPDVCPTTLGETAAWRDQLGLGPDDLRVIFFSVDPKRDTIEHMQNYLSAFGEGAVIGLTGTEEEVEKAKKAFGIYSARAEGGDEENYLVDHTATVFLLDRDGQLSSTISYREDRATALDKVRRLVGS